MTWTYIDDDGRRRLKRRYAWALRAYAAGLLCGLLLATLL